LKLSREAEIGCENSGGAFWSAAVMARSRQQLWVNIAL